MFSEDSESSFFKVVKGLLYAFMIGAVYYAGCFGYALFFTRKDYMRKRIGRINLIVFLFEILAILAVFIFGLTQDSSNQWGAIVGRMFLFTLGHFLISLVGSIFYLCWYGWTALFGGSSIHTPSTADDEVSSFDFGTDTQNRPGFLITDLQRDMANYEVKKEERRVKAIERLRNRVEQFKADLNPDESDYASIDTLSETEANRLDREIIRKRLGMPSLNEDGL